MITADLQGLATDYADCSWRLAVAGLRLRLSYLSTNSYSTTEMEPADAASWEARMRPMASIVPYLVCRHLKSPGTNGYTVVEARQPVAPFGASRVRRAISFADLLLSEVGQHHSSRELMITKRSWPRPLIRILPMLGLLLLIEAWK